MKATIRLSTDLVQLEHDATRREADLIAGNLGRLLHRQFALDWLDLRAVSWRLRIEHEGRRRPVRSLLVQLEQGGPWLSVSAALLQFPIEDNPPVGALRV